MGKKTKKKIELAQEGSKDALGHNPFAALGGLSAPSVPPADAPQTPQPTETTAATESDSSLTGRIVLRQEKKGRGGKTVTRISGIEAGELQHWAARMKKALGCGATVEGDEVLLLGALEERAAQWLKAQGASRVTMGTVLAKKNEKRR